MILFILFVILFVFSSNVAFYFHNRFNKSYKPENNEVIGIIFGASSLIYSLIISFAIVAVWSDYEELNSTIEQETDKLNGILAHSSALPDSLQILIKEDVLAYCQMVVDTEWNRSSSRIYTSSAIPKLRLQLTAFHPQNERQEKVFSFIDDNLSNISDLHRERLSHTRSHVPTFVWLVLITNSLITIYLSFFFVLGLEKLKKGFISILSAMIAMSLFLIYDLDHPFMPSSQISNEPYKLILQTAFPEYN